MSVAPFLLSHVPSPLAASLYAAYLTWTDVPPFLA